VTGNPSTTMKTTVMTWTTVRKSTHHLAWNADPNSLQAVVAKRLPQAHKHKNALGLRLRSRLKRPPSSPRSSLQSLGRLCPRSRWMFPSLLRKCFAFPLRFAWELLRYCRLILLLDRVNSETFSAATSGTSMDIYKDQDDEETEDAATSKAGTTLPSCPRFVNCTVGRLNSYGRVFCSTTKCH
jgi:hypothetical protein